jgi:hypothetical protein
MTKLEERLKVAIHDIAIGYLSWGHDREGEVFSSILRDFVAGDLIDNTGMVDRAFPGIPDRVQSLKFAFEIADKFRNFKFIVEHDLIHDPLVGTKYRCLYIGTKRVIHFTLMWETK